MNKTDLIKNAAAALNINIINDVRDPVNAFLHCLGHALAAGEDVLIQDVGTFRVKKSPARTGRNPKTGEAIQIPAQMKVSFKPAKALKEKVNAA